MTQTRKDEILDAFEQLVAKYGLDKVTMQEVAREAGISVGAIYLDYANKDGLIEAIEDRWRQHVELYNKAIVQSADDIETKLYKLIVEHVANMSEAIRTNQAFFELIMGTMRIKYIRKKMKDKRQEIKDAMRQDVEQILQIGVEQGIFFVDDIEFTAGLFVDAFGEYFSAATIIRRAHEDVVNDAKGMFELLMKALKNPEN